MKYGKVLGVILACLLIASVLAAGCAAPAPEKTWRLSFAHGRPVGEIEDVLFHRAADAIAERTNNRVQITIYPARQLGDTYEVTDGIAEGSIDMGVGLLTDAYDPMFSLQYLDYLFLNVEDAREAQYPGGWMYELLSPVAEGVGIKILAPWWIGIVGLSNTKHPVRTPADLEGIKVRCWPTELATRVWKNYGADVIGMPWGEVFTSFQLGTIDASWNSPHSTYMFFRDIIKHYTHLQNMYESNPLMMNLATWNSLPSDIQTVISEEIQASALIFNDNVVQREIDDMNTLETEHGVQVIRYDDLTIAEKKAWIELARSYWPELKDLLGEDILNLVLEKATPMEKLS